MLINWPGWLHLMYVEAVREYDAEAVRREWLRLLQDVGGEG